MATSRSRVRSAGRAKFAASAFAALSSLRSLPRESRRRSRAPRRRPRRQLQAAAAQARAAADDRRDHAGGPHDSTLHLRRRFDDGTRGRHAVSPQGDGVHRARRRGGSGSLPAGDSGTYFQNLPVFDHSAVSARLRSRSTGSPSPWAPTSFRATTRCSVEPCARSTTRRSYSAARSRLPVDTTQTRGARGGRGQIRRDGGRATGRMANR